MTEYTIPEYLREQSWWVIWDGQQKVPLAPWATGDMYPAGWGDGVVANVESRMDERPETVFQTAKRFADSRPELLHGPYPFPTGDDGEPDIPDRLLPTVLLPHYPPDPPLMQVDFDDVRNRETGVISEEVLEIIDRLDAFAEVSISGEGVHLYVRAELPGGLGKFIADLDGIGAIELYDHGRFTACTWNHIPSTPITVPERQEVIDELVDQYENEAQRRRREGSADEPDAVEDVLASIRGTDDAPSSNSPYYDLDIRQVADTGDFSGYRKQTPGNEWNGPHPEHGPMKSAKSDCTNFGVEPSKNAWYCRAHDIGGGPLSLIAVLEGIVSCAGAKEIHRDAEDLLKTCVAARDNHSVGLEDEDPPYGALVAIAEKHDLSMVDPQKNILGEDTWRIARIIYANTELEEL